MAHFGVSTSGNLLMVNRIPRVGQAHPLLDDAIQSLPRPEDAWADVAQLIRKLVTEGEC